MRATVRVKSRMATAAKKPVKHGYFGPAKNEAHRALAQAASWERSRTEMKMFFGNDQTLPHGEQDGTRRSLVWPRVPAVDINYRGCGPSDPAGPDAGPVDRAARQTSMPIAKTRLPYRERNGSFAPNKGEGRIPPLRATLHPTVPRARTER